MGSSIAPRHEAEPVRRLKILPPELMREPDRRRRFVQEARAASAVNHPAIAQIYDIEEEGDLAYIAMEWVDGSTVRQLVARKELDLSSAVEVGIQVGDALAGPTSGDRPPRHQVRQHHGDARRHPKISTSACEAPRPPGDSDAARASLMETLAKTQAGMIVGTLAYMSRSRRGGFRRPALRHLLLRRRPVRDGGGEAPLRGASALDTMHAIAYEQPQP